MAVTTTSTYTDLEHIYFYDASAGTYSANKAGTAAVDYFPDDAAVGDYLVFATRYNALGFNYTNLQKIRFNVGTALVADAITVVWEYYGRNAAGAFGWYSMPNISDGPNAFQNLGTNYVTWDIPFIAYTRGWYSGGAGFNSITGRYWIRCRITALTNLTEGGANTTNNIAHWNGKATVTSGTVTFQDIYDQMVTDGLTADVTRSADGLAYEFRVYIEVNSGATLADTYRTILFKSGFWFKINSGGTLTLGTTSNSRGYNGGSITGTYLDRSFDSGQSLWGGSVNFYGCNIYNLGYGGSFVFSATCTFRDCFIHAMTESFFIGCTIYACKFQTDYGSFTCNFITTVPTVTDFTLLKNVSVQFQKADIIVYNLTLLPDAATIIYTYTTFTLRNSTLPAGWSIYYRTGVQTPVVATIQYSLDLKVQDKNGTAISGASVAITNVNGVAVSGSPFTTDANGDITQTYLTYKVGTRALADGVGTITMVESTPHTVTISKSGYITKTIKYTMDQKRIEVETLEQVLNLNFSKHAKLIFQ